MDFLKKGVIEGRLYQETILATAANKNTLVVLPTGLGKTYVAALLAAHRLSLYKDKKILFLAPTKPLVEQHCSTWKTLFDLIPEEFNVFTGGVPPEKRNELYNDSQFVFATPQVVQNDIISKTISLEDFSLVIFDEAHRATGNYPYGFIAKKFVELSKSPRILALTASPGSRKEEIEAVCKALYIEGIESREASDKDVSPYVKQKSFEWIKIELPKEFKRIKSLLESVLKEYLKFLKQGNIIERAALESLRKRDLLMLQGQLASKAPHDKDLYPYLSCVAAILKLYHALELLETQGIAPLCRYFNKLKKDKSKAAYNILIDSHIKEAISIVKGLKECGIEHPKIKKLLSLLNKKDKFIIFANYRASVDTILKELKKNKIKATKLIGHAKEGFSQKKQMEELNKFREGDYNVIICTSVGEEGLDLPEVDRVIFYEPVPSAIRSIQRGGRTARYRPGKISILMTKGTRDEAYYWSSHWKERRMKSALKSVGLKPSAQHTLDKYARKENVVVFADTRESGSGILKELSALGVEVRIKRLDVADFQLSSRVGVERKSTKDFIQSLIDGRLLSQISRLVDSFEKPVVIVEGETLHGLRYIHPNAVRGSLAAIIIDFGVPILYSSNVRETASFLSIIAKREQLELKKDIQLRGGKKPVYLEELQRYVVESLPNVGPTLAKRLLKRFGSVENIVNASEEDLKKVETLGDKKAKRIKEVLTLNYTD